MIKAFIFDMDGVIINSEPLHKMAERRVIQNHGHTLTDQDQVESVGRKEKASFELWARKFGFEATPEALIAEKNQVFIPMLQGVELMEGLLPLVKTLSQKYPLAVATSSYRDKVDMVFEKFGLKPYFQVIVSGEEVTHSKPAPDIFLLAAERLAVAPADCCVIEDASHGVEAAKHAGMRCIGFESPYTLRQDLRRADHVVHSLAEILDWPGV